MVPLAIQSLQWGPLRWTADKLILLQINLKICCFFLVRLDRVENGVEDEDDDEEEEEEEDDEC